MSTIKLFKSSNNTYIELQAHSFGIEKSLQKLIEKNLERFLNIRFLYSEYQTTKSYSGRIDTLGLDENGSPVIIEYKNLINENVINQGLFYLDWLLDHQGEFTLLVMDKLGKEASTNIEWDNSRLLCIASEFTKYDAYAVQQINRNIELIRYRIFDDDLILFELVNATSSDHEKKVPANNSSSKSSTVLSLYSKMSKQSKDRFESVKAYILSLGDDIQEKTTKVYIAYRRLLNFASFVFLPNENHILLFLKVDPTTVMLEDGFSRDVTQIGHLGTGNLELRIKSDDDFLKAKDLILRAYLEN